MHGQFRDSDNIGNTRHRMKTCKTKNTTQKIKEMSDTEPHQEIGCKP